MKKDNPLPLFLKPFLWSYDLKKMNAHKHKSIIIKNILDLGNRRAINWLKTHYSPSQIKEVIKNSFARNWSAKSLHYWSQIYQVSPQKTSRFDHVL